MIQGNAALTAPEADEREPESAGAKPFAVQTRFGEMQVDPGSILHMPRGLLGFSNLHDYALASLPPKRFGQFQLLQSLEQPEVSFIVAPYDGDKGPIAADDVAEGFRALDIPPGAGALLLIVSIRKLGETTSVSVNLRAPILVDARNRTAWQHVLANPEYPVRFPLTPSAADAA